MGPQASMCGERRSDPFPDSVTLAYGYGWIQFDCQAPRELYPPTTQMTELVLTCAPYRKYT
jgi:hypothetical protein